MEANQTLCWVDLDPAAAVATSRLSALRERLAANAQARLLANWSNAPTGYHESSMYGLHLGPMQWGPDHRPTLPPAPRPISPSRLRAARAALARSDPIPGWDVSSLGPGLAPARFAGPDGPESARARAPPLRVIATGAARGDGGGALGCALSKREVSVGVRAWWLRLGGGPGRVGVMRSPFPADATAQASTRSNGGGHGGGDGSSGFEAQSSSLSAAAAEAAAAACAADWGGVGPNGLISVYYHDPIREGLCHGGQMVKAIEGEAAAARDGKGEYWICVVVNAGRDVTFRRNGGLLGRLELGRDAFYSRGLRLAYQPLAAGAWAEFTDSDALGDSDFDPLPP